MTANHNKDQVQQTPPDLVRKGKYVAILPPPSPSSLTKDQILSRVVGMPCRVIAVYRPIVAACPILPLDFNGRQAIIFLDTRKTRLVPVSVSDVRSILKHAAANSRSTPTGDSHEAGDRSRKPSR